MPGLVPGIHVFLCVKAWMAGSSPAMTTKDLFVIPAKSGDPVIAGASRNHDCRGVLGPRLRGDDGLLLLPHSPSTALVMMLRWISLEPP